MEELKKEVSMVREQHWGGGFLHGTAALCAASHPLSSLQDDHKMTLEEIHRKYGTDLTRVRWLLAR